MLPCGYVGVKRESLRKWAVSGSLPDTRRKAVTTRNAATVRRARARSGYHV